jgi:hypothetical protein
MHLIKALAKLHCQMQYEIKSREGTAISASQRSSPSPPRCAVARAVAWPPRHVPRRSEVPAVIRCAVSRTYRWTGAATPTRQRAGDVIGVGYANRVDNVPWSLAASAPPPASAANGPDAGAAPPAAHAGASDPPARTLAGWLAAIPRRLGTHLFVMGDAEAYWHGWQITSVHGGLGRRYRDPLFITLRLS